MHRSTWLVWSALLLACARSEALPDLPRDPRTSAAPSDAAAAACSAGEWCWAHGRTVYDLAAAGGAVFAVGSLGAVLSWTGDRFASLASPTRDALRSVWLSGPGDVWVTNGASEVFHYDGESWTQFAAMGSKLAGSAPSDVWLDTQHFDGTGFRERRPPGLGWFIDLLARAPDDVWVLGLPGTAGESIDTDRAIVMHFDGGQWRQRGSALDVSVWNGKLVNVDGEVWLDTGSSVFRLEGDTWREQPGKFGFAAWQPPLPATESSIALFDGESVARVPLSTRCTAAARVSARESFCFSEHGGLFRKDGASWRPAPQDPFGETLPAEQWGRVSPELWTGEARVAWGTGPANVFRVRASEANDPAVSVDVLERYDGRAWTELARGHWSDIAGSSADDVWIAGSTLLRWDGEALREVELPAAWEGSVLTAAVSFGPKRAYFVERDLGVLRYDGAWSVVLAPLEDQTFDDIAGDREDELWVTATHQPMLREKGTGLLLRFDGARWQTVPLWSTWGLGELALDRDSVWISDSDGVYRVSRGSVMDSQPQAAAENTFDEPLRAAGFSPFDARLWRGPSDLWLTTSKQAMRFPL